jgi:hypothetical protein
MPYEVECILLASMSALDAKDGPFSREKWHTSPPEVSDFVMIKEPRERRDYAWTWRIQNRQLGLLETHLTALVKSGDAKSISETTRHWVRFYPLFGGVRRQIRRMLNSGQKLWQACQGSTWPGQNSECLPAMVGFRKEN